MCDIHIYKDLWSRLIGQEALESLQEKENEKYQFAIAVYRNDLCYKLVVVHVPLTLSKVLFKLLQWLNSILTCKVTGRRVNRGAGYGFAIQVTYTCTWCRERGEMETTEKMKNKYLKYNSLLLLYRCPLIRKKFWGKYSFGAKKIFLLISMSTNCLSALELFA